LIKSEDRQGACCTSFDERKRKFLDLGSKHKLHQLALAVKTWSLIGCARQVPIEVVRQPRGERFVRAPSSSPLPAMVGWLNNDARRKG
jgi:hypothetical protein